MTCGHAIDVPEIVFVCESEPTHAAVMLEPGAWTSTQGPKFEKLRAAQAQAQVQAEGDHLAYAARALAKLDALICHLLLVSELVVEPTVMASGADAGE